VLESPKEERTSMREVTIIGVDLAKRSFQLHGAAADGSVVFRKQLSRSQFLAFLTRQPKCIVAMEACATSHYWGREIAKLGHEVKLIPPIYVKPFVKRQKNDTADAEAIAEAASRPTMRFVAVKSEIQQAQSMVFRTRDLLVRQRTQMINALRGHLAEYGVIAPQGTAHIDRLAEAIEDPNAHLPEPVRELGRMYLQQIADYDAKIDALERAIRVRAKQDEAVKRLMTVPGIGPICAMAIQAFAPPVEAFKNGRDFAAWLGMVPRQNSTGGKQKLGKTSKMGQRDIRRLLIIGATSVVKSAKRKGTRSTWLARMLACKPPLLVATALANKMARMVWALMTKQEDYRDPAAAAA
jgi:transposase